MDVVPPLWEPRAFAAAEAPRPDEVSVWRIRADRPPEFWLHVLSPDERQRLARLKREDDRRRFAAGRGGLRHILAAQLHAEPAQLRFGSEPGGKPILLHDAGETCRFNVAHSGEWALIALSPSVVGIDIEAHRPIEAADIVGRFFATEERSAWQRALPSEQPTAFFDLWSLKEAYLKATGRGLSQDPRTFCIDASPGHSPRLVRCECDLEAPRRWRLVRLPFGSGYSAALAAAAPAGRVRAWEAG